MRSRVASALRSTFWSLRTRNYRLFFGGQLISNSGNWLTNVALTLFLLHLTGSGLAVGLLAACMFGPILVLSPFAGVVADRSHKLHLLMVTQSLEMVESVALGLLAFLHHPPVVALYLTAACGGCLLAFDNPVRRSFVTEMVPKEDIPNAVVLYSAVVNTSRIFGPALAGLLVVTLGYGWCFELDAASYVAVLIALFLMRPAELNRTPTARREKGQVRAGVRYVRNFPELYIAFVLLLIIGTLSYNYTVVLPLLVEHALGGGDGTFTLLYSVFSVGALASALVAAHRNAVSVRQIIVGAVALGITMLGLGIVPGIGLAFVAVLAVGMASIWYMTATTAIVQVRADPAMHGRVLALQSVLFIGTTPIGGPLLGYLAGARTPVLVGGVAALGAALWGKLALRRHGVRDGEAELVVAPVTGEQAALSEVEVLDADA